MSGLSFAGFTAIRSAINTTNVGTSIMMPVGGICMYPSATPPEGYLLCDGATITIEDYPNLYAIIGNAFGAGQSPPAVGSFYVPDMRGRFVVGNGQNAQSPSDQVYNINDKGGEQEHVLASDEVGEHTHNIAITDGGHSHTATATSEAHTHGITDAGHTHAITDAGHTHTQRNYGNYGSTGLVNANDEPSKGSNTIDTSLATTGITIDTATTGIVVVATAAGVTASVQTATANITAEIGTTATAAGHENRPPFIALAYIIRAL